MDIETGSLIVAGLLSLFFALFMYAIFIPKNIDGFAPDNSKETEDNPLLKLATKMSGSLYASLPKGVGRSNGGSPYIQALIVKSGNPWGLKAHEFRFFQVTIGIIGLIAGYIISMMVSPVIGIPWWVITPLAGILGFFIPFIKYNEAAKKRDLEFKRHLPETLDLITISLAGQPLSNAIRDAFPNMPEGVLKEEFAQVIRSMEAGKGLNESLETLVDRAPNESIQTFVRAVQEANSLDVSLVEVLQSRAKESRAEFFALINNKTAALPSKMMGALTPTLLPALMIVLLAPSMMSLVQNLG